MCVYGNSVWILANKLLVVAIYCFIVVRESLLPSRSEKIMFWSACIYLFIGLYVCYQLLSKSTGPNCMKFSGMICHHPRTNCLDFGSDQVKGQGHGHKKVRNYWLELHEIFRDDLSSSKDQSIRFWKRSGQRSRPRS